MTFFNRRIALILLAGLSFVGANSARADYSQRFSFGLGFINMSNPSQTSFQMSGEYENKFDPFLGLGLSANYIFSNPSITLIAVPDVFFHPLMGDFLVSAAPLFEFGSGTGTHAGVRLGTRLPLPVGLFTIVPSFSVDFINGGHDYIVGLGISF